MADQGFMRGGGPRRDFFQGQDNQFNFGGDQNIAGRIGGASGGPKELRGWNAAPRYAMMPAQQLWQQTSGIRGYLGQEAGRDYESMLFGRSREQIDQAFSEGGRQQRQFASRAGYAGGDTVSPLMERQIETETAARAGQYGSAARESVLNAQAMRMNANREFMNYLTQMYQAFLTPAQLQVASTAQVPTAGYGPSPYAGAGQAAYLTAQGYS